MAKTSKATKKFQNKHLKHTLDHRREVQKQNKKIARRRGNKDGSEHPNEPKEKKSTRPIFDDMSVEEFFEGGFEVPKPKKSSGLKQDTVESDLESEQSDNSSEESEESEDSSSNAADAQADEESSEEEDEEMMKQDMANLEKNDPEFYKYLKSNEKSLLDFEGVNPMEAISDESSGEEEETATVDKPEKQAQRKQTQITKSLVAKWDTQLKSSPNAKTIQNVISAFKTVVYINSSDTNETRYAFTDPAVFTDLMFVGLRRIPEAIQKLAPYKKNSRGVRTLDDKNDKTNVASRLLKSQAGAYITLLSEINNTETAALVLASVQEVLPFYVSQRKILKQVLNAVVDVWASSTDVETQVATYAFMNNIAREYPKSTLEIILRASYSSFVKNCRKTNVHNMDSINFAKNSAAELFSINEQLSYTVGFEFIRQLAVHLRNTISSTSNVSATSGKDAYKAIYNWQFCHSLDFWSRVLSQLCNPEVELANHKSQESPLRPLIYPLVQVTLGAMRLIPTAQFFPLRFYLIRSLIRLSQGSQVYIPIYPLIGEILTSTAFTKPPKNVTLPAVDFDHVIKVNQQYLGTRVYQEGLCEQFLVLTSEFLVLYSKSIAFPELVTPVILSLRRFMKKSKNNKFNKQLQQLVEKLNANAAYITTRRSNVEYGPSNKAEVQAFLKDEQWQSTPLGQYVVVHRKSREEKARILKEAIAEEEKAKMEKADADVDMENAIDASDDEGGMSEDELNEDREDEDEDEDIDEE